MRLRGSILVFLASVIPAFSQRPVESESIRALRRYFQLTDAQVSAITAAYNAYSSTKQNRIQTVQNEIQAETAKDNLDGFQIGIRYAEIEAICRDLRTRALTLRQQNVNILTPAQKAKLAALDDAMKLASTINAAQGANLLGDISGSPSGFSGSSVGTVGPISGYLLFGISPFFSVSGTVYGCTN